MQNRSRAYYRHQRWRCIRRKYNIRKQLWGNTAIENYYSKDGKTGVAIGTLSKGKIHCSCPMCRTKFYDKLSHRDKKYIESANEQLQEYFTSNKEWQVFCHSYTYGRRKAWCLNILIRCYKKGSIPFPATTINDERG